MTNEKKPNMSDEQKLYPQLIYRINSILSDIKSDLEKDYKEGELFIAPSVLDPHTRTFNWLMVNDEKWKFLNTKEKDYIEYHIKDCWKKFEKEFIRRKEMETVSDAIDIIKNSADEEEYHFALLSIYQFYPNNPKKYIDGIIYRNIARRAKERNGKNHRIDYAQVTLQCGNENKNTYILYPWVEIDFFDNKGIPERKYSCQEFNPSDPKKRITKGYPADDNPDVDKPEEIKPLESALDYKKYGWGKFTPATLRTNHFHKNYFVPFFVKDEGFNPKEFYKLSPKYLSQRKYIYVKPLYDALHGEYGNLCAVLQIPFVKTIERDKFNEVKNILINRLPFLVNEIKNAAFFEILKQPIEGDDLLEHFIKYLPMLQDWERIMLWEIKKGEGIKIEDAILQYCYKRENEDKWNKCEPENINTKCKNCKTSNSKSYFDNLKNWIIKGGNEHLSSDEADFPIKNSKRKVFLEKILTQRFIPELYKEDAVRYKNFRLIYEYPPYTIFPEDESRSHTLGLFYERQQIDLLRQLAIKRKVILETIRHGTKSALLSIDVRNMSHNIASHVLAYWIQEINQLLDQYSGDNNKLKVAINKSKALFRYIQHRADFLAEVATSIPCSEMSFDLKKEILNPFLNDGEPDNPYTERNDPLTGNSNIDDGIQIDSNVYVLLRYIADSEGITINFDATNKTKKIIQYECIKQAPPTRVSIPSGTIGKHAIYSIFENFIRNAAKHYKGSDNGNGFIKINVSEHDKDYVKVEITDIRRNSCNQKIVKELNGHLKSGFVDEQGRMKSGGWGIKEMLISANFLRKNTPEDLYDIITDRKDCNPPLLKIICSDSNTNTIERNNFSCKNRGKNLGIRFYLKRPKHLAVLDSIKEVNANGTNFEISKISGDEYKDMPISHNILLVDNKSYESYKDNPLAPCRVRVYDKSCESEGSNNVINDKVYLKLYKQFIEKKIWCDSSKELPKIVNNMDEDYQFADTQKDEENMKLSLKTLNDDAAKDNIVFVSHPEAANSEEAAKKYFKLCHYFQPMSGGFSTKAKFYANKKLPDLMRKHFYLELIEAALTKVVIVDERVSEWANQKSKYFNEPVRKMLKKMNVYVPEINKENITDKDLKKKLCRDNLGCEVFNNKKENPYFFVIHQGILDKLKNNGNDFMEKIKCRWKVIDSGRGVPEKMEHRFVQISALQTLLENYDKHGLVQTLFSLRKPVKEGQSGNQAK